MFLVHSAIGESKWQNFDTNFCFLIKILSFSIKNAKSFAHIEEIGSALKCTKWHGIVKFLQPYAHKSVLFAIWATERSKLFLKELWFDPNLRIFVAKRIFLNKKCSDTVVDYLTTEVVVTKSTPKCLFTCIYGQISSHDKCNDEAAIELSWLDICAYMHAS